MYAFKFQICSYLALVGGGVRGLDIPDGEGVGVVGVEVEPLVVGHQGVPRRDGEALARLVDPHPQDRVLRAIVHLASELNVSAFEFKEKFCLFSRS